MKRTQFTNRRGTSTLEFIVVLPCLLIVMFGSVELSRAWYTLNLATTAAREAARAGAVECAQPGGCGTVSATFPTNATAAGQRVCPGCTVNVTCSTSPCATDSQVTATVTNNFQTLFPILLPVLQSMTITQTGVSRYE